MMVSKLHIFFVYPNGDEIECQCKVNDNLFEIGQEANISMDKHVPKTLLVRIDNKIIQEKYVQTLKNEHSGLNTKNNELNNILNLMTTGDMLANFIILSQEFQNVRVFLNLIRVNYIDAKGILHHLYAYIGENMTDLAHRDKRIDLPFACGGNLACSTCHCVLDEKSFNILGHPSEDEEDLLTFIGSKYSRIGCQIVFDGKLDNCSLYHPKSKVHFNKIL